MFVSLMHVYCVTNVYSHANACTHTHTPCLQVLMSIVMERLDCRPVQSLSPLLQIAVVPPDFIVFQTCPLPKIDAQFEEIHLIIQTVDDGE